MKVYLMPMEVRCGACGGVMHTRHSTQTGELIGYCLNVQCTERRKPYVIVLPALQAMPASLPKDDK